MVDAPTAKETEQAVWNICGARVEQFDQVAALDLCVSAQVDTSDACGFSLFDDEPQDELLGLHIFEPTAFDCDACAKVTLAVIELDDALCVLFNLFTAKGCSCAKREAWSQVLFTEEFIPLEVDTSDPGALLSQDEDERHETCIVNLLDLDRGEVAGPFETIDIPPQDLFGVTPTLLVEEHLLDFFFVEKLQSFDHDLCDQRTFGRFAGTYIRRRGGRTLGCMLACWLTCGRRRRAFCRVLFGGRSDSRCWRDKEQQHKGDQETKWLSFTRGQ